MSGRLSENLENIVKGIGKFAPNYELKNSIYIPQTQDIILINSLDGINKNKKEYQSGIIISPENKYLKKFMKEKGYYDILKQEGYIHIPPGVRIERLPQKDIGHGILGTASLSGRVIQVLETLYGKPFLEVLMHEANHIANWHQPESWIRYKTKNDFEKMFGEPTTFH